MEQKQLTLKTLKEEINILLKEYKSNKDPASLEITRLSFIFGMSNSKFESEINKNQDLQDEVDMLSNAQWTAIFHNKDYSGVKLEALKHLGRMTDKENKLIEALVLIPSEKQMEHRLFTSMKKHQSDYWKARYKEIIYAINDTDLIEEYDAIISEEMKGPVQKINEEKK